MAVRAHINFGRKTDLKLAQERAVNSLSLLDAHLLENDWLAFGHPTLVDITCFPYAALAEEADVLLAPYKNLAKWFGRVSSMPSYIAMPGLPEFNS
jgi:glutathione S-transferase